ncbi:830_t:CDS:2 [Entrophospora sp. SA101]|nr:830_t:CDS:2 [Entrophospora sp. SA101]
MTNLLQSPSTISTQDQLNDFEQFSSITETKKEILEPLITKPMLEGNISTFLDMILNYYKAKSLREFRGYNEVAFQTAVELLLPTNIVNGNGLNSSIILELKCISLVGLLSGEEGRWIDNPGYKSLMALDAKLEKETENELLKRIYFYWCKEKKKCERVNGSGVCDDKIKIEKGEGFLGGFLLVSIAVSTN